MWIRKWRYLQNLENARSEGRQEGLHEANKRKFEYITYLEEENKALKEKLEATAAAEIVVKADCCPETNGIPDRCENCHVVQGFCDEESFF